MSEAGSIAAAISALATSVMAAAAVAGAIIAAIGLTSWKAQNKWQRDNDLAKDIFVKLRKRHDAFRSLRARLISGTEQAEALGSSFDTTDPISSFHARNAAINKRMLRLQDIRNEMYPLVVEATIFWGDQIETIVAELADLEDEVLFAHQDVAEYRRQSDLTTDERNDLKKLRSIAFGDRDDPFGKNYGAVIRQIENALRNRIGGER